MKKIAIIGTGIMGSGMARNFLTAGYSVYVWNRSSQKTQALQQAGAQAVGSPRAAAEAADTIFEVTANDESSQAVWQGEDGILAGASADKVLVASATLSAAWTLQLSELCSQKGYNFLDMPLTGGRIAAENGSLTLLVGGDESVLGAIKPDLAAISAKIFYFGQSGSGMKYKLILNSLQAAHIAAFGEAMKLAGSQGLDPAKVGDALCDRPGGVVTNLAWDAYQKSSIPLTFSVDWITKDLEYARQMALETKLPLLDDVLAYYQHARSAGHGAEDWAWILKH